MDTNLMGSTSFEFQFNQRQTSIRSDGSIVGAGVLAIWGNLAQDDAGQGAGNGRIDNAVRWSQPSFNNGLIFSFEILAAFWLKLILYLWLLGHE